jgi:hydroxymethylpyrimidine pyrophosphatase-like HAD family hydrolase
MDGTLLRSDGTVSERTRATLRAVGESGMAVVVVSARPPRVIRRFCEMLELDGLALCCNGAIVYDPRLDSVVDGVPFEAGSLVGELRRAIPGVVLGWEGGLACGCDEGFPLEEHFEGGSAFESLGPDVHKVLLNHPELALAELLELTRELTGTSAAVTVSGPDVVEVMAAGVSKAAGVERLAASMGTDLSAVVAFGDMPNDVPLLEAAGLGVAVRNAHAEVLEIADEVTASNDEDGVAVFLEGLLAA